jgi:hypothetical protein
LCLHCLKEFASHQILPASKKKERKECAYQTAIQNAFKNSISIAEYQWLTPLILATEVAEIRRIIVQIQPSKQFIRSYLENDQH